MEDKVVLKCKKDLDEGKYAAESIVPSESEKPSSEPSSDSAKLERKSKELNPQSSSTTIIRSSSTPSIPTVSENASLLSKAEIIVLGFLASAINYNRTADFAPEQLYFETILVSVIYYLVFLDINGSVSALLGGYLQWYLSLVTKSQYLTVLIMTYLQVHIKGIRYFEWVEMMLHIWYSCISVFFMQFTKLHSLWFLLWGLVFYYFDFLRKFRIIYFEDIVFLSIITLFSARYNTTGDIQHCFLYYNFLSSVIIWMMCKHIRSNTGTTVYSLKLF